MTKPSPRFPINTVEELFDKLKWNETRLMESWGMYESWDFILTAHHLYKDWIGGRMSQATTLQKDRWNQIEKKECLARFFQAIGNVADGSKHFDLDWSKKKQIVDKVTDSEISDYDSYFFGKMPYIKYDGHHVSMYAGSAVIMRCFEWLMYGGDPIILEKMSSSLAGMKIEAP